MRSDTTVLQRRNLNLTATFDSGSSMSVSSAETRRAFNSGFDTVTLHRPTVPSELTVLSVRLLRLHFSRLSARLR
jgi:hypothetical protein